jgi:Lon-like protease
MKLHSQSVRKSIIKLFITAVITAVMLYILFGIQLPNQFIAPGKLITASKIVRVENGNIHKGKILIPTIIFERTNVFFYLYHMYDRRSVIKPFPENDRKLLRSLSFSGDSSGLLTEESVYLAKILALRKLGYDIPFEYEGIMVMANQNEKISPLKPGDIILYVDGKKLSHPDMLTQHIEQNVARKDSFRFTFIRENMELSTFVRLAKDNTGRLTTGILYHPILKRTELPVKIEVNTEQFEGTSASLAIFLEILNQLSDKDLTGGKKFTVTGTIDNKGNILPVEGAGYKLMGAEKTNCDFFICPEENLMESMKYSTYIKIIPVKHVDETMEVLEMLINQKKT